MLNSILLDVTVSDLNVSTMQKFLDLLFDKAVALGEKIILAIIIYFVGAWLIRMLQKLISKVLLRKKVESSVSIFLNSLIYTLLKIVLFIIIIGVLGIETTSFAAILAAAGLAVGMAMKDNLSNFAGGVMILLNKPFKLNDRIFVQGIDGVVQEIGILYTILLAADGRTIYIPNGPLSTGTIVNYSVQDIRRVDITLTIGYGNDTSILKQELSDIIAAHPLALKDPAPFVGITMVNNGTFDITIRVWVKNQDFGVLNVDLNERIYEKFSEKKIFSPSVLTVKMS